MSKKNTKTTAASKGASAADIETVFQALSLAGEGDVGSVVNQVKAHALHARPVVADLAGKIADSGKGKETTCELALGAYTALANEAILASEAYLVHHLPAVLNAAGHKNAKVR